MHQREVGQTQLHSCLDTVTIIYKWVLISP